MFCYHVCEQLFFEFFIICKKWVFDRQVSNCSSGPHTFLLIWRKIFQKILYKLPTIGATNITISSIENNLSILIILRMIGSAFWSCICLLYRVKDQNVVLSIFQLFIPSKLRAHSYFSIYPACQGVIISQKSYFSIEVFLSWECPAIRIAFGTLFQEYF